MKSSPQQPRGATQKSNVSAPATQARSLNAPHSNPQQKVLTMTHRKSFNDSLAETLDLRKPSTYIGLALAGAVLYFSLALGFGWQPFAAARTTAIAIAVNLIAGFLLLFRRKSITAKPDSRG